MKDSHEYKVRRARARWLEGAPEFIADVFGAGPNDPAADRFTIFFVDGEPRDLWSGPWVQYLGCSEGGRAVSMFGELEAHKFADYRSKNGRKRIRWSDLSEATRAHVVARYTESN